MAKYIKTEEGYKDLEESVLDFADIFLDPVNANISNKMDKTNPTGTGSFSMNRKPGTTIGNFSFAEGYSTTASGKYSHAEGGDTTASGVDSHAEGNNTTASGDFSHAEGSVTKASGSISHAEGYSTTASGKYSHAEGGDTTASGVDSHAEGSGTTASGGGSHAEGSVTTASGGSSHAEGSGTTASGYFSHAEGFITKASSNYQHVQGKYNIADTSNTYAHIVGNGTSDTVRSNAHTLDWNGNAWYQGDVYVGGTNQTTGSKKLATEEYVDELVPDLSNYAMKEEIPEQVQSDWNQSNTYSKDYIKNRPFYINETLQTEAELTLTNGEGTAYVSFDNTEGSTSSTVRDVHVVMKRNSEIVFDLTGTANYTGNPIYDWGFASLTGTCSLMPGRDVSCKYIDRDWSITVDGQDVSRLNGVYTVYCYSLEINKISDIFIPDTIARTSQITVPDKLPNPNALTFTGAVNATYDGSSAVSVEIPSGGGGESGAGLAAPLRLLASVEPITEPVKSISVSIEQDGIREIYLVGKVQQAEDNSYPYATIYINGKTGAYNTNISSTEKRNVIYHGIILDGGYCLFDFRITYATGGNPNYSLSLPQNGFDGFGNEIKEVRLSHSAGNGLLSIGTYFDIWGR